MGADGLGADGELLFDGGPIRADRPVYAMAYPTFGDRVGLRTDGWKLVRDRAGNDEALFDLSADPEERRNLLEDSAAGVDDVDPDDIEGRREALSSDLEGWLSGFEATQRQEVDAETEEMLADLGYRE